MCIYSTFAWNTNWYNIILRVSQGHPVASSLPISACSSPVLEKPSQTAVAKGGCVCENTHLSPADGSFSGHTVPPARLPSRAWPSPQPAQQATGIASPRWQDPFYGLRSATRLQMQVNTLPSPATSVHSVLHKHASLGDICCDNAKILCAGCFFFSSVSNMSRQLPNGELVNWDRTVCRRCWIGQLAWHFVFMLPRTQTSRLCACASRLFR